MLRVLHVAKVANFKIIAIFNKLDIFRNRPFATRYQGDKVPRYKILKKLIKLFLSTNIFRFDNQLYKQIKGSAMGTPMEVNYAKLFLDKIDNEMLDAYGR